MKQAKILVIDDDEGMTELLELLLLPISSCILVANTGAEGVELARTAAPNLIILDLMLPGMNGWEISRAVRSFSTCPILILSAIDSPDIVARALDAGADDYLVKPVSSNTLIARLNNLLRRPQAATGPLPLLNQFY